MNKWLEVVLAWFVGGFIGRLFGHTYLVDHRGWPEISGWLSVPVGMIIAWLAVEIKAIVPAVKHVYRWTRKPTCPKGGNGFFSEVKTICKDDIGEFKKNWNWRIVRAICYGLLWSSWLLHIVAYYMLFVSSMIRGFEGAQAINPVIILTFCLAICTVFSLSASMKFLEFMGWSEKTYDRPYRIDMCEEKNDALEVIFALLIFNPISPFLILLLIACPYFVINGVVETVVWIWAMTYKTIRMINSSRRTVAMTGAAIGLSISQIYGYNPIVCGGVCIVAGLIERSVFVLAERVISGLKTKQTV